MTQKYPSQVDEEWFNKFKEYMLFLADLEIEQQSLKKEVACEIRLGPAHK